MNRIESPFGWSLADLAVHRCTRGAHKPGLGLRSTPGDMGHHTADTRPFGIGDLFFRHIWFYNRVTFPSIFHGAAGWPLIALPPKRNRSRKLKVIFLAVASNGERKRSIFDKMYGPTFLLVDNRGDSSFQYFSRFSLGLEEVRWRFVTVWIGVLIGQEFSAFFEDWKLLSLKLVKIWRNVNRRSF